MLEQRGMTGKQLAARIGISETQMSLFRSGKVRGVRFTTLSAMCAALECRPGDLLDYDFAEADLPKGDGA
ncbi:helix-turn-helix transcriptional regulator [Citromicrobium bathyomarinum]|uniref:helix-turn-helix domain-containing protein n=1 Tax=Citromicrobium bathyomarinum TaxID=72174 RepID=UPI003159B61B